MDSDGFCWDHRGLIHGAIDISLESAEKGKTSCMNQMGIKNVSSCCQGVWLKAVKIQRFSMHGNITT